MLNSYAVLLALCLGQSEAATSTRSGFASSDNFLVYAPDQELADEVLKKSEQLRKRLAKAWLGEELPLGAGAAVIQIKLSATEDKALTWIKDHPGKQYHSVSIRSSREKAVGVTLAHELTHVILATKFLGKLPRWADEGVASFQDESELCLKRRATLIQYSNSGEWPNLTDVLNQVGATADEHQFFSVATSISEFLLDRGDESTFFKFAIDGQEMGWESAARKHYEFPSLKAMELRWQEWVENQYGRGQFQQPTRQIPKTAAMLTP